MSYEEIKSHHDEIIDRVEEWSSADSISQKLTEFQRAMVHAMMQDVRYEGQLEGIKRMSESLQSA